MACRTVVLGGVRMVVCGPRARRKRCACGETAPYLCDWKLGGGKTCDKPICEKHAEEVGHDKHLCPEHTKVYAAWLDARSARISAAG